MKYLKLFENKERDELRETIPELGELCQDLKDHGFEISFYYDPENITMNKFNGMPKLRSDATDRFETYYIDILCLKISKYHKNFFIKDIIDNLLFITEYATSELGLKIHYYVYTNSEPKESYCENIEDLPKNIEGPYIIIRFTKGELIYN